MPFIQFSNKRHQWSAATIARGTYWPNNHIMLHNSVDDECIASCLWNMGTAGKMYNTHGLPVASIDHISTGIYSTVQVRGFTEPATLQLSWSLAVLHFCLNLQSGLLIDWSMMLSMPPEKLIKAVGGRVVSLAWSQHQRVSILSRIMQKYWR